MRSSSQGADRCCWVDAVAGVAGLLLVAFCVSLADASVQKQSAPPPPPPRVAPLPGGEEVVFILEGYGVTEAAAWERALERAQEKVEELLRQRFGPVDWRPRLEQLEPRYLEQMGVLSRQGKAEVLPADVGVDRAVVARYRIELTPNYLGEVQRLARQEKVQARHLLLARILAGLVAVLLVTAGYLRLEEMSNGYATKLLRLGVAIVLALVAGGLWLTV